MFLRLKEVYLTRKVALFLLLCMFRSRHFASLCCSVYCLCANVYYTTATECQPNCSYQIYHIISIPREVCKFFVRELSICNCHGFVRRNGEIRWLLHEVTMFFITCRFTQVIFHKNWSKVHC